MVVGNYIIIIFLNYYIFYLVNILFKKEQRKSIQEANIKLDEMRKIKVKSLEEQKEFLNVRYPKAKKFKFTWKLLYNLILRIAVFLILVRWWLYLFGTLNLYIPLWVAIITIMIGPVLINMVLEKFNMQKTDWRVMFK